MRTHCGWLPEEAMCIGHNETMYARSAGVQCERHIGLRHYSIAPPSPQDTHLWKIRETGRRAPASAYLSRRVAH